MIKLVISEIGAYNNPKAINPIWKLGIFTPKANESNGFEIKIDQT